ncbi:transcriptional regulator, LysR family [Pedobacter westerhofensis]|uniref:Transcriptional regulator, LysR family n=1 Tax=Pedobacter westerhofensis TaxID=425512 RepID=A0A521D9V3_9SPHI|nr:LysR substrate-binding domain-containing protein [Pedobacter westerhofensis]SMO68496.1 transcriptional regulator, LysR family [Pedobacter westerhofensis]
MLSLSHVVFLEVAANLSFSKAAKVLYISQPAISRHIHLLEDQYNCALFERKGNSIQLTVIGETVYKYVQEARAIQRKIEFEVSTLIEEADAAGSLKIGASTTVSLYIIPGILSAFHKTLPKINMQVVNRNTENIITALHNKQIDVGIVEVENKINLVNYDYFTSDQVIAVCAAKSPLAQAGKLPLDELLKTSVALREVGSGTLSALSRELKKHDISISDLQAKVRLGGTEALKNFILADLSLGFLPQKAVTKELLSGDLVEIHIEGLEISRDFFFLTRHGENFDLIKKFIRFSQQVIHPAQ